MKINTKPETQKKAKVYPRLVKGKTSGNIYLVTHPHKAVVLFSGGKDAVGAIIVDNLTNGYDDSDHYEDYVGVVTLEND